MPGKINPKIRSCRTLFVIFFMVCLWFTPGIAGEPAGGDSPQAVFDMAQAAGAKKDFSTLAKMVAPSERPMLAFATDMGVGMLVEFYEGEKSTELKKKYKEIQNKYGIENNKEDEGETLKITNDTPQEVIDAHIRKRAKKLYGHVDAVKFVPDLMGIIATMPEMSEQAFFPQEKLSNLKIDGDRATGEAGEKKISFLREDNRWYLTAGFME